MLGGMEGTDEEGLSDDGKLGEVWNMNEQKKGGLGEKRKMMEEMEEKLRRWEEKME